MTAACGRGDAPNPAVAVAPRDGGLAAGSGGPAAEPFDTELVDARIYERRANDKGIDARAKIAGRRVEIHARLGTPLAGAIEANEVLTLELSDARSDAADQTAGTVLMGDRTRTIVDFDSWLDPARADILAHAELVGLWRVQYAARSLPIGGGVRTPKIDAFIYDGQYIIVGLPVGETWPAPPRSDRYRLPARWLTGSAGDESLQMRIPVGGWQTIATFEHEGMARRLVMFETGARWPIERVRKPADAAEPELALVASAVATQSAR